MIIDLHVHTTYSPCSGLHPDEIFALARDRGLDGVCITDHNTMAARALLQDTLRRRIDGREAGSLLAVVGMEYDTPQGDFLLLGPFEALRPGLEARELLPLVAAEGGVAIAAHPFRADRPLDTGLIRDGLVTTVEGINGRNSQPENLEVEPWRQAFGLKVTGGSDAHSPAELGACATRFFRPIASEAELIAALRQGAFEPAWPQALPAAAGAACHA